MTHEVTLVPATDLAARNHAGFPNESAEHRQARNALLAEEIELRRHIERIAEQRVALAMVARSPVERLVAAKKARGWTQLEVYSDGDGDFTRDYVSAADEDVPGFTVFTRRDGTVRHFWSGEIGGEMADPGQYPRGAPDLDPLWSLLDTTPAGRGTDWYPKLDYGAGA
jgi:predicted dithiol-disulfide oxidoreductase (DUF899 family)